MKRLDSTIGTRNPDGRTHGRGARRHSRQKRSGRSSNSYLGVGRSLGSDRDRQRLQDRNAAERSRVERMLAEGPAPIHPTHPSHPSQRPARWADSDRFGVPASSSRPSPSGLRALPSVQGWACPVCASCKVVSDEVAHINAADDAKGGTKGGTNGGTKGRAMGVTLRLSECLHCDHRWTERMRGPWSELGQRMSAGAKRSRDTNTAPRSAVGFVRPVATPH